MTPKRAQRRICTACLGLNRYDIDAVRHCDGDRSTCGPCPLFPYRLERRMPVRFFRKYCLQCQGGSPSAVDDCSLESCAAHRYRFGRNPSRRGIGGKDRERGAE